MADKPTKQPEPKKFSLKPIETQLLKVIIEGQNNLLSNTLSFIAIERLAVTVDANTKFDLNADMSEVTITQVVPDPPAEDSGIIETPSKEK